MSQQRIKGQEVSILIVRDGVLENELTDIQNFGFEPEFEILSVGYLGEKTKRKDEIFNGCKWDLELNIHEQLWFQYLQAIKDRAQRKLPDLVFNISAVCAFPNGQTPTVLFPDVKFGTTPHTLGAREDYLKIKLQGECEDFDVSFT